MPNDHVKRFGPLALREAALGLLYLVTAQTVVSTFLRQWGREIAKDLPGMLSFTIDRPFAFRLLSPALLKSVLSITPYEKVQAWLHKPLEPGRTTERLVDSALATYRWPEQLSVELLLVELFLVCVVLATAYAWRLTLTGFALPPLVRWLAPALALCLLPFHFAGGGYIYDFPELLLASVATWAFFQKRYAIYYPVLALAVLNKESAILLVAFTAFFFVQGERKRGLQHVALHGLVALPVFIAVRMYCASRGGSDAVDHLSRNAHYFLSRAPLVAFARTWTPLIPMPQSFNLVTSALLLGGLLFRFKEKPLIVRATFVATLVALLPAFVVYGNANEVRVFALCFPSAIVLCAFTLQFLAEAASRAEAARAKPAE